MSKTKKKRSGIGQPKFKSRNNCQFCQLLIPEQENEDDLAVLEEFEKRRAILQIGCGKLETIQRLVDARDFDGLLSLHEEIYARSSRLNPDEGNKCTAPGFRPANRKPKIKSRKFKLYFSS